MKDSDKISRRHVIRFFDASINCVSAMLVIQLITLSTRSKREEIMKEKTFS